MTAPLLIPNTISTAPSGPSDSAPSFVNNESKQSDTSSPPGFSAILTKILPEHISAGGNTDQAIDPLTAAAEVHELPDGGNISPLPTDILAVEDSMVVADTGYSGAFIAAGDEQQASAKTPGTVTSGISSQLVTESSRNPQLTRADADNYNQNKVISYELQRINSSRNGGVAGGNIPGSVNDNDSIAEQLTREFNLPDYGLRPPAVSNNTEQFLRQALISHYSDKSSTKDAGSKVMADALKAESTASTGLVTSLGSYSNENRTVNQFTLPQPVTHPQWSHDFNDRVRWLLGNQIQKAELTLNPRSMGAIEISISLHNDQTSIHIVTQNSLAKDAVDNSLGRLREMLGDAGINQADVDVSQHSGHDSTASERDTPYFGGNSYHPEDPATVAQVRQQLIPENYSLIDYYA